jgi:hypothetical protein
MLDVKEKNLIGLTINGKKITEKTPSETWPGGFYCSDNKLTSLVGAPSSVGSNFWCSDNKLTSLVGAPSSVGGYFDCSNNNLTSLKGIEKILKKMNGAFYGYANPLKSHVIGLLLVPGCKEVGIDDNQVEEILNRNLQSPFGTRRFLDCQSELLDANLDEWAKL